MRLHITLDDDLVRDIDRFVGPRGRSAFIANAVKQAVMHQARWAAIEAAFGSIPDTGHDWDEDPAAWVREQRRSDPRRSG